MKVLIWFLCILVYSIISVILQRTIGSNALLTLALAGAMFAVATALSKRWDVHLLEKNGLTKKQAKEELGKKETEEAERHKQNISKETGASARQSYFANQYKDYDEVKLKEILENGDYSEEAKDGARIVYNEKYADQKKV